MQFEWDENKNTINKRKHNISFEKAIEVFLDNNADTVFDYSHSSYFEDRYRITGLNKNRKLISIIATIDNEFQTIRIISARKASIKEELSYYGKDN